MDEFLPAPFDGQTSDPYDGLGETAYYHRLHAAQTALGQVFTELDGAVIDGPETVEWRDADALGDPDLQHDLALDREMGV